MKIFIPARHGLGDVIDGYFINPKNNNLLGKLGQGYDLGLVSNIIIAYEEFMNPAIGELFSKLPFPVTPRPTHTLGKFTPEADHNNNFPNVMGDYINLLTNTPSELIQLEDRTCPIPVTRVDNNIPDQFILFTGYAGETNRFLTDSSILESIRANNPLPIVSVGMPLRRNNFHKTPLTGDVDLTGQLSITQVFYLASKAELIISSLSFLRCCGTLFNKKVAELVQHPSQEIINRTNSEYQMKRYGINQNVNWFRWPYERDLFNNFIRM